jgi:hypothetical protein
VGVKRDGILHNLRLLRRDTVILQKRAHRIGAVYLEAILRRQSHRGPDHSTASFLPDHIEMQIIDLQRKTRSEE